LYRRVCDGRRAELRCARHDRPPAHRPHAVLGLRSVREPDARGGVRCDRQQRLIVDALIDGLERVGTDLAAQRPGADGVDRAPGDDRAQRRGA